MIVTRDAPKKAALSFNPLVLTKPIPPRRRRYLLPVVLWTLLASVAALAQPPRYHFNVWTTENGLPHNSITAIKQTHDGYLWLATPDGLARFDGMRFTVFNTTNSKGIRNNRVTCFFEDEEGALWIGTEEGITCYREGAFVTYTTDDGLPGNYIRGIQSDNAGGVLICTSGGIARWRDRRFSAFDADVPVPISIKGYDARTNIFWYNDGSTLYVFNQGKWVKLSRLDGLPSIDVKSIYRDQKGALWIATRDSSLTRLQNGSCTVFPHGDGLPDKLAVTFAEDRHGALWIGTDGGGLVRFKDNQFKNYKAADGLSANIVLSLCEDREGNIWVGTGYGGLDRLNEEVITVFSTRAAVGAAAGCACRL